MQDRERIPGFKSREVSLQLFGSSCHSTGDLDSHFKVTELD